MVSRNDRRYRTHRAAILKGSPTCWICGQPIDTSQPYRIVDDQGRAKLNPAAPSADHIKHWARGGRHEITNLRPAHLGCNMARSNKPHANIIRRSGTLG